MNNEPDYSIEAMITTFAEHAKQAEIEWKKYIELYVEQYPSSPLPGHFKNNFNVYMALSVMCEAIQNLKIRTKVLILTDEAYDEIQEIKKKKKYYPKEPGDVVLFND